jgi:hypothetical protein
LVQGDIFIICLPIGALAVYALNFSKVEIRMPVMAAVPRRQEIDEG